MYLVEHINPKRVFLASKEEARFFLQMGNYYKVFHRITGHDVNLYEDF